MLWFYLLLISVFGSAIANIFRRVAMKYDKSDAVASAVVFQFIGALLVGMVALWHGFVLPPIARYPWNVIAQAIFWGGATLSLFQASRYLEASETAIITSGSAIVTIFLSVLLLHESFTFAYSFGTILILISIYLISSQKKVSFNKGTVFAIVFCLLAGLGNTNDAYMLKYSHSDTLSLLTLGFFAPGIFLLLVHPRVVKKIVPLFHPSHIVRVFLLTFFYAMAAIAYFFAIHVGGEASRASAINQSEIILTVVIGAIFLNETDRPWKKIVSALLVTAGVLLLS